MIDRNDADNWRKFLLANLIGTENTPMADIIVSEIHNNESLGLVFPDDPTCVGWEKILVIQDIANRIGIKEL